MSCINHIIIQKQKKGDSAFKTIVHSIINYKHKSTEDTEKRDGHSRKTYIYLVETGHCNYY